MTDEPTDRPPSPSDPVTAAELWRRPWYVVPDDEVGGWAIATADLPTSQLDPHHRGQRVIADAIWEEHARWLVEAHNALVDGAAPASTSSGGRTTREDAYVIAYGQLHETVRRFLAGDASVRYLRRRHAEIEDDLAGLLPVPTDPTEET